MKSNTEKEKFCWSALENLFNTTFIRLKTNKQKNPIRNRVGGQALKLRQEFAGFRGQ